MMCKILWNFVKCCEIPFEISWFFLKNSSKCVVHLCETKLYANQCNFVHNVMSTSMRPWGHSRGAGESEKHHPCSVRSLRTDLDWWLYRVFDTFNVSVISYVKYQVSFIMLFFYVNEIKWNETWHDVRLCDPWKFREMLLLWTFAFWFLFHSELLCVVEFCEALFTRANAV